MAGIGDATKFPNSKMAAAAKLGQSRLRSTDYVSGPTSTYSMKAGAGIFVLVGKT